MLTPLGIFTIDLSYVNFTLIWLFKKEYRVQNNKSAFEIVVGIEKI